ncbi:Na(+)-translocating NADH-quinone reductase subunit C [candidate division KSB1 bacterium]|nr:Na(+)-translocating NADH-quinone reductase subunit C [candidate division KSB1 bacterium]
MSNDSTKKTITVALGVCLVCSILVSTAAVSLKSIQDRNKELDKLKNILSAGDLYHDGVDINAVYAERIQPELIDLETGLIIPETDFTKKLNPAKFDIKAMAKDPEFSKEIPSELDKGDIGRMPTKMAIYKVMDGNDVSRYILPMYGKGLWSTMYGFMALHTDITTIMGFTFYEHGETPGLGGEVDNPRWKRLWIGKQAFDMDGNIQITVVKGIVDPMSEEADYQVDGLSGSTLTTRGVDNLVKFWLGDTGYGTWFSRIKEQQITQSNLLEGGDL